jgi:hypothetical protein
MCFGIRGIPTFFRRATERHDIDERDVGAPFQQQLGEPLFPCPRAILMPEHRAVTRFIRIRPQNDATAGKR